MPEQTIIKQEQLPFASQIITENSLRDTARLQHQTVQVTSSLPTAILNALNQSTHTQDVSSEQRRALTNHIESTVRQMDFRLFKKNYTLMKETCI